MWSDSPCPGFIRNSKTCKDSRRREKQKGRMQMIYKEGKAAEQ